MQNEERTATWGGHREGSGRKRKDDEPKVTITSMRGLDRDTEMFFLLVWRYYRFAKCSSASFRLSNLPTSIILN